MPQIGWRKTVNGNDQWQPVTVDDALPVRPISDEEDDPTRVTIDMAYQPPVAGETITRVVQIPGIGTASAYAAGDAFGTLITFHNVFRAEKCSGTIVSAFLLDLDDEGIQVDVPIYVREITATADNSAAAPTDSDLLACRGYFSIANFLNLSVNQIGVATNIGLWVKGESPNLYTQVVTQGAHNIAAGAIPYLGIVVIPD